MKAIWDFLLMLIIMVIGYFGIITIVKLGFCEEGLPETQECILIAVPENGVHDWHNLPESK